MYHRSGDKPLIPQPCSPRKETAKGHDPGRPGPGPPCGALWYTPGPRGRGRRDLRDRLQAKPRQGAPPAAVVQEQPRGCAPDFGGPRILPNFTKLQKLKQELDLMCGIMLYPNQGFLWGGTSKKGERAALGT